MNQVKKLLIFLRYALIYPFVHFTDEKFQKDIARWKRLHHLSRNDHSAVATLLWYFPEFRNLLLYRSTGRYFFCFWVKLIYPPMDTLFIQTPEIGGGLYIQHGFATMISAESIGANCWINQQVTIGYNGSGRPPIIGDNVMVTCGAKVLGSITVGDNAVIGANAVVIRDVEPGATMVGIPAHRIK